MEQNKESLSLEKIKKRKEKRKRNKKILIGVLIGIGTIAVLCLSAAAGFMIMRSSGENSLKEKKDNVQDDTNHEGYVTYNGKTYQYKEDMVNILCLGIDIRQDNLDEWEAEDEEALENEDETENSSMLPNKNQTETESRRSGQADAIFILALDTKNHTMDIIAVPRDTMVPVKKYTTDGKYIGTEDMQITLQHAYGDGKEQSCELMEEAVSNLFYGLPINGYCSINMLAVPILNDAVGGVEVTIDQDLKLLNPKFEKGTTLVLEGEEATDFVCKRDIRVAQSSLARIGRQKQYMMSFIQSAKNAVKEDVTLPVSLFQTLTEYMVTDITVDEVAYLAPEAVQSSFSEESLHIVEVEVKMGEKYEEYYVKEDKLYQLILDVFYEEVETEPESTTVNEN